MNARAFRPHVTVAAVVEKDGRFLVVREYVDGEERINNPAGHVEDRESPLAAVVREVREETGYGFVPEALGGIHFWREPVGGETFVRFNFVGRLGEADPAATLDAGIIGPDWMSLTELEASAAILRSPLVVRSFREYRDSIRYPLAAITDLTGA